MTLSEELAWRGFINQSTFEDIKKLDDQTWTFYHGFDASADSLTVGNLAGVMVDKVFMRHGGKAYILAGGATSLIGDPGGKDIERPLQDESTIVRNVAGVAGQLEKALEGYDFTLVNNLDWTKDLTVIAFLRDIGKYFSMTPLVQRDFIARRMGEGGSGISYTEFSYTLLQGMDFLHLYDEYGVNLQVGSSDQWGNCLSGVELIRRARNAEVFAFTHPLVINKVTGKKFGKSEAGAVWLDPEKTSPEDFYQFWINSDDDGVEEYLKVYTELDKSEVDEIMHQHGVEPKQRVAQKRLAFEVTKLIHGPESAKQAQTYAENLRSATQDISDARTAEVGDSVIDMLVAAGLVSSKTEARRILSEGGVYINDRQVSHETFGQDDFVNDQLVLRRGKKLQNTVVVRRQG